MIVSRVQDELRVVTHAAHSEHVGELARAWGNEHVEEQPPGRSLVFAAVAHDRGWFSIDRDPPLDRRTGQPLQFLSVGAPLLRGHAAAISVVADRDPYAGLLMSLHISGVLQDRFGWDTRQRTTQLFGRLRPDCGTRRATRMLAERRRFLRGQVALRRRLRRAASAAGLLDEARVMRDYDRLQVWDELSLYAARHRSDVMELRSPNRAGFRALPTFTVQRVNESVIQIDPFPFGDLALETELAVAAMPDRVYRRNEFKAALRTVPLATEVVTFIPG